MSANIQDYHPVEMVDRFRFTCLYCRWRRGFYLKFVDPPFWIDYTYKSLLTKELVDTYRKHGLIFKTKSGRKLEVTRYKTLKIDPRGHFTKVRCAAIIVLDNLMKAFHIGKPLVEFCEFFANYPTW